MQAKGGRLIKELKGHILIGNERCSRVSAQSTWGASYRDIEELAGLNLELPAQDGWLTWSILMSLNEDRLVQVERRGRRLFWRLSSK